MKLTNIAFLSAFAFLILFGCTGKGDNSTINKSTEKEMIKNQQSHLTEAVMLLVKAKTELTKEEFLKIARERESQFEAIPGLIQKYYIKTSSPGEYGGVYIWDSMESFKKYKESELAATIAKAYKTIGPPSTEIMDILFELRE